MKFPLAALAILLTAAPAAAGRDVVDSIAAVVNQDLVLRSEWAARVQQIEATELATVPEPEREEARLEIRRQVLDLLIDEALLEQAMDRADLVVDDREIEQAIADVARQNRVTVDVLYAEVARQGLQPEAYREELRKQIRHYKFMNLEIRGRIEIDEAQLRAAWAELRAATTPVPAWRLERVFVPSPVGATAGDPAPLNAAVQQIFDELTGGRPFPDIVVARAKDPASLGLTGTTEPLRPEDLAETFVAPLRAAPEGTVVRVDAPSGAFLVRIAEVVDVSLPAFDDMKDELANSVYERRMDQELDAWTAEERRKGHIEVRLPAFGPDEGAIGP